MIDSIYILLALGILADLTGTYVSLWKVKSLGRKDWADRELNPFLRYLLKEFGLHRGMAFGSVVIISIISIVLYFSDLYVAWGFLGMYIITIRIHIHNICEINKFVRRKNVKEDKRKC